MVVMRESAFKIMFFCLAPIRVPLQKLSGENSSCFIVTKKRQVIEVAMFQEMLCLNDALLLNFAINSLSCTLQEHI